MVDWTYVMYDSKNLDEDTKLCERVPMEFYSTIDL